jgi:hypothetical protein
MILFSNIGTMDLLTYTTLVKASRTALAAPEQTSSLLPKWIQRIKVSVELINEMDESAPHVIDIVGLTLVQDSVDDVGSNSCAHDASN